MNTENQTQDTETEYAGQATYCPEDNCLRLYIGRVPRDEYLALKAEGWRALYKQREAGQGDFVATWTPTRRDTALRYAGIIEDEDAGPEERAADRAERFIGYGDKRLGEAETRADRYDSGPAVHGYQSYARAVKAADRHDRIGTKAVDAWEKAEYWQRRTAGVIAHQLYKSSPAVRMGRIKEIEADLRRIEKSLAEYAESFRRWKACEAMAEGEAKEAFASQLAYIEHGDYTHPRTGKKTYLFAHTKNDGESPDPLNASELCVLWLSRHAEPKTETDWTRHLNLRLAYENQMIEAQGGRAAFVEMEVGGWLLGGRHLSGEERQITQVNKSPKTGRVVSVVVRDNRPSSHNHYGNPYPEGVTKVLSHVVKTERMDADVYRAPTDAEREAFKIAKKAAKAAAPKADPCPLINPTDDDAERLQESINERHAEEWTRHHGKPSEYYKPKTGMVQRITQAVYSENSKGSYAHAETRGLSRNMELADRASNMYSRHETERKKRIGAPVCQIRITGYDPVSVIVLTDKPQKALPVAVWEKAPVAELVTA